RLMAPSAYLILGAILFSVGTLGVLLRRNALVIFMSIELMLNAVNLTLVTFARMRGTLDGQVLAFFVIAVAAAEVVVGLAIVVAGITFFRIAGRPEGSRSFVHTIYTFFHAGGLNVNVDYRIDPLSITMMLVVTGVGTLIHLYSIGYMRGDPREGRYFQYLNLFAFSMLLLVMANNFLIMFVGWELVGLCSYLLIGFW